MMSEKAEAAECLSADERINEKRSIRTAEYYSALTREDILTRVTMNEISQRQRHKYRDSIDARSGEQRRAVRPMETERRRWASGAGEAEGERVCNGDGVSVQEDEKVLEMGGGNGCTSIYLVPYNCTLKNGLNGKFHVMYVLPQLKKNQRAAASSRAGVRKGDTGAVRGTARRAPPPSAGPGAVFRSQKVTQGTCSSGEASGLPTCQLKACCWR